jgi:hypothetical protein
MTAIDPRQSERHLLAAVHRWARTNGWRINWTFGWVDGALADATVNVKWSDREIGIVRAIGRLSTSRPYWSNTTWIRIRSTVEAVDVLVALGILPPFLSSAYAMAEDHYREQVEALTEDAARQAAHIREMESTLRFAEQKTAEAFARRDDAERRLWNARMVRCWTNEDGKRFVFADDLFAATDPDIAAKLVDATSPGDSA